MTGGLNLTHGNNGVYNGLDRFGRMADPLWEAGSFNPADEEKHAGNNLRESLFATRERPNTTSDSFDSPPFFFQNP